MADSLAPTGDQRAMLSRLFTVALDAAHALRGINRQSDDATAAAAFHGATPSRRELEKLILQASQLDELPTDIRRAVACLADAVAQPRTGGNSSFADAGRALAAANLSGPAKIGLGYLQASDPSNRDLLTCVRPVLPNPSVDSCAAEFLALGGEFRNLTAADDKAGHKAMRRLQCLAGRAVRRANDAGLLGPLQADLSDYPVPTAPMDEVVWAGLWLSFMFRVPQAYPARMVLDIGPCDWERRSEQVSVGRVGGAAAWRTQAVDSARVCEFVAAMLGRTGAAPANAAVGKGPDKPADPGPTEGGELCLTILQIGKLVGVSSKTVLNRLSATGDSAPKPASKRRGSQAATYNYSAVRLWALEQWPAYSMNLPEALEEAKKVLASRS